MKESVRTIILLIVLVVLIGFIFWVRQQSDVNLQSSYLINQIIS